MPEREIYGDDTTNSTSDKFIRKMISFFKEKLTKNRADNI